MEVELDIRNMEFIKKEYSFVVFQCGFQSYKCADITIW